MAQFEAEGPIMLDFKDPIASSVDGFHFQRYKPGDLDPINWCFNSIVSINKDSLLNLWEQDISIFNITFLQIHWILLSNFVGVRFV